MSAEAKESNPETKKQKLEPIPQSPDEEWPEAWLIPNDVEDQKAENKYEPNKPVSVADLKEIGIR